MGNISNEMSIKFIITMIIRLKKPHNNQIEHIGTKGVQEQL